METQYYTLMEKQDFFEIIENKFGELVIFIDSREGSPENPVLKFDGKETALLKRDKKYTIKLDNIDKETRMALAEAEFLMIVELTGKVVERTYAVSVENVETAIPEGKQTRADEWQKAQTKEELLEKFGAIKSWKSKTEAK